MNIKERRLVYLDSLLRRGGYTRQELMEWIEEKGLGKQGGGISVRTLRTDLKSLGELTGGEVACVHSEEDGSYRYRYKQPSPDPLPSAYLESRHLRALYVARDALRCTQTIPEAEVIHEAIERLKFMLYDYDQAVETVPVEKVVRFCPSKVRPVDPDVWQTLFQAVREQREVSFHYKNAWGGDGVGYRCVVQPLRLVNLEGEWYLFALKDGKIRQYHLLRMERAKLCKNLFHPPSDLNFDLQLENTFGRFFGDPTDLSPVKLRFSERIYPSISGHKFHRKQRLEPVGDGRMDLTFWVTKSGAGPEWAFYSVRSFVLSYGEDCEVLQPKELRDMVIEDLKRAGAVYAPADAD